VGVRITLCLGVLGFNVVLIWLSDWLFTLLYFFMANTAVLP
jgi:hypothetical protein